MKMGIFGGFLVLSIFAFSSNAEIEWKEFKNDSYSIPQKNIESMDIKADLFDEVTSEELLPLKKQNSAEKSKRRKNKKNKRRSSRKRR